MGCRSGAERDQSAWVGGEGEKASQAFTERARPTIVRRGHPCARGDRRAPHGRPRGPRARAQRSARRPWPVQRRASAPRPLPPRLRRTRVLLPGPLSHGSWGCQGTRPPPHPPCASSATPAARRHGQDLGAARRRGAPGGAGQRPRLGPAQSWGAPGVHKGLASTLRRALY